MENNLPNIITEKDIQKYLHIGDKKLYELMKRKDFPSFQIGTRYFVLEDKFTEWMENQSKKLKYSR